MPLPSPRNKESRSQFVNRCMANLSDKEEFKNDKQRLAVCYGIFKDAESKASVTVGEGDHQILYFAKSDVEMESDATGGTSDKTKEQWDKINQTELEKDTKRQKEQHEKDAVQNDKSKIKKLGEGKPSEKKTAEKKALEKDIKYDKKSEEADAAERFGGKKRSDLKDSDFLDPKKRSFPVMSCKDVKDAVSSWGRYTGSMTFDQFKSKLTARANKLGCATSLPKSWKKEK